MYTTIYGTYHKLLYIFKLDSVKKHGEVYVHSPQKPHCLHLAKKAGL